MSQTVRIRPITGKFLSITVDGITRSIYTVSPRAVPDSKGNIPFGTEVEVSVARKILSVQPPVASIIPEIKNGKFVSPLENVSEEKVTKKDAKKDAKKASKDTSSKETKTSKIESIFPTTDSEDDEEGSALGSTNSEDEMETEV